MTMLKVDGTHAAEAMEQYEDSVTAIFDSANRNRVESSVLLAAIEGLTKVGAQYVNITNCKFKESKK